MNESLKRFMVVPNSKISLKNKENGELEEVIGFSTHRNDVDFEDSGAYLHLITHANTLVGEVLMSDENIVIVKIEHDLYESAALKRSQIKCIHEHEI